MGRSRFSAGLVAIVIALASTTASAQTPNISQLRKAAENGDPAAQHSFGAALRDGTGVSQDVVAAAVWLSYAAYFGEGADRMRYKTADRELFDRLSEDQWREVSRRRAAIVRPLAESGRAWAQFALGLDYYDGTQTGSKDPEQALRWFEKAAKQGYSMAQFMVGMSYLRGNGAAVDAPKGIDWLRKAATQGHLYAQLVVGNAYFNGNGVSKDLSQALQWWRKAADRGLAEAQANLGAAYVEGDRGVARDYREGAQWYLKAADQGFAVAQAQLAAMYEKGLGVIQDTKEALYWFRLAAGGGDVVAQYRLGISYRDGGVVARNAIEAHKWLNLAASRADGEFQKQFAEARDGVAQSMTAADLTEAQKRAREWMATFERAGRVIDLSLLPPPPPPSAPVRVGGEIQPPAKTKHVEPVYPAIALSARVQGIVMLEATIDPTGKVMDVKPLGTPPPLLVQAAIDAVKQWEYAPTLLNGVPVPVIMTVTANFAIK
jgi:TonB family protein